RFAAQRRIGSVVLNLGSRQTGVPDTHLIDGAVVKAIAGIDPQGERSGRGARSRSASPRARGCQNPVQVQLAAGGIDRVGRVMPLAIQHGGGAVGLNLVGHVAEIPRVKAGADTQLPSVVRGGNVFVDQRSAAVVGRRQKPAHDGQRVRILNIEMWYAYGRV